MRPPDLPFTEHFQQLPCGSRAKYVAAGCRCPRCRAANSAYAVARDGLAKEAAAAAAPREAVPAPQVWTAPDGTKRVRTYKRACQGVNGKPCPYHRHLRKDSTGDVCGDCRKQLVWNGLVAAERARRHLLWLSKQGVGRHAVHAASDIAVTVIDEVRRGVKTQIRAETERRILAVDRSCISDGSLVDARPSWRRLNRLLAEGYPARRLCKFLGYKNDGLQFGERWITAGNALRIEKLYRELLALPEKPRRRPAA